MASKKSLRKTKGGPVPDDQIFSLMFEENSAVMLLLEPQTGTILDANQAALNFYGYAKSEICSMSIGEINALPSDQVGAELKNITNEKQNPIIYHHRLASGKECIVEVFSSPMTLGERQMLFLIIHDVTDRKLVEEKLTVECNFLRMLLDNLPDRIYVKDMQGRKVFSNIADWQGVGVKAAEDVLGKTDFDTYPSELAAKFWADDRSVLDSGKPIINRKEPGLDGQGNPLWILTTKVPLRDENRQVTGLVGIGRDITERDHAEQVLRENESRFHSLFDDSPISLWEEDFSAVKQRLDDLRADGITDFNYYLGQHPEVVAECVGLVEVLDVNKATLNLYGAASKEDLVKNLADSLPEAGNEYFRDELVLIASGMLHFEMEMIAQTLNGKMITINLNWAVIPGYESNLSRVIVSIMDITERKQADAALHKSEEQYRTLFDSMMDGIYRSTHAGKFVDVNPAMVKMFGFSSKEEMLAVDIKRDLYFAPEERGSHVLDTGQEEVDVYRMRRKDGTEIWVEDHGYYVHDEKGDILYHDGMLRDITGRKLAEEAVTNSEKRFRALIENGRDNISLLAADGTLLWESPSTVHTLGYTSDQFVGRNLFELIHPDDKDPARNMLLQVTRQPGISHDGVFRLLHSEGSWNWIEATITNLLHEPSVHAIVINYRDITERKRAEQALKEAHDRILLVFDSIPADVYVADMRTYKILFMNQHMCNSFGDGLVGKICWQVFRGASGPCSHCTNDQLIDSQGNLTGGVTWEGQNPINQRWYTNYDRAIRWIDGKLARVQISVDITGRKQAEDDLRRAKETLDTAHQELEKSFMREQKLAHIDELTGINNRRSLFELAGHEFNVAIRYRPPLSVLMFDIDHFKHLNDSLGHAMGDQVLKRITQTICERLRASDIFGRYGGDEFVILLPQSTTQEAQSLSARIHASIAAIQIDTDKGQLNVTVSIGIATTIHNQLQPDTVEKLFLRADQALYAAKQAGRNRTVVFEEITHPL